jgi:CRP-like cAMP-binding protein
MAMTNSAAFNQLEEIGIGSGFEDTLCGMLEDTVLFHEFSHPEIETLAKFVHAYRAPKGTQLFEEGGRDSYLCIITKGRIDVFKETQEFEKKKLATIREGSAIGEMSVIDGFPHSASAVTNTEAEIVILTKANLQRICDEYPQLGNKILWRLAWQMSSRLRQTSGVLIDHI